jgi:protein SCO1/2
MRKTLLLATPLIAACWGSNAYIVTGEVIQVSSPTEVVIKHEDVPGLMPAMTMPFTVRDPALVAGLEPGDRVYARLITEGEEWYLAEIRERGRVPASTGSPAPATRPGPLRATQTLPRTEIPLTDGTTLILGAGQATPVLLTFLYTTCPRPEFCPALATRLQGLQAGLQPGEATLLAVTIDPTNDTLPVLKAYAEAVGADPAKWRFGRLEGEALADLAARAALTVDTVTGSEEILHSLRVMVFDDQGRLVERYDDARFPAERVLQQLLTGGPPAPPDSDGTLTKP